MTAYVYNAPSGVAGDVTRPQVSIIDSVVLGLAFAAFGAPFKLVSDKAVPIESGDAASVVKGFITRSVPSIGGNANQGLNDGIPNIETVQGALKSGYMNIECKVGTPSKGGQVFVRITAAAGKLVGDLETAADAGACVAIVGCEFAVSGKDASNITEIFQK